MKNLLRFSVLLLKRTPKPAYAIKLATILLFIGILQVSAGSLSRGSKLNFDFKDVSVEEFFKEIESQTDYRFLYRNETIENLRVSVQANNADIDKVLGQALAGANIDYKILSNNLIVIKSAKAGSHMQPITVAGTITSSEDQLPLPGVNVLEKGTTNGTVTNAEGNFSITVDNADAILVFSFLGYASQEVKVGTQTSINLALKEETLKLDELVFIGYGNMKRSDLSGAVVSIKEEDLKSSIVSSLDQALQGKAAGVDVFQNSGQPGGGISVRIRGTNSINSNNEPLYIIDGIPVSGRSQADVIGFDWGGGGNGQTSISALATINPADIISIEVLKDASATAIYGSRASNGVVLITTQRGNSEKSVISYESYFGIQQASKYLDVMNLSEYADYQNELAELGLITEREEFQDVSILGEGTDWQDEIYRNAGVSSHQLSFTGGSEKSTYAISGGYFKQDGIIIGSGFERYSGRINLDHEVKSWFKVGNSFMISRTNQRITLNDDRDGVVSSALLQSPLTPVRNIDGSWGGPAEENNSFVTNPVAMASDKDLRVKHFRVLGNFYGELSFLKYFKFRSEIGVDVGQKSNYGFIPTYNYGNFVNEQSASRRKFENNYFWIWKNYITYNQIFAEQHNVTLTIAQESQESTWEWLQGDRKDFLTNDIQELNAGDAETATNEGGKGSSALLSYFGRLIYSYSNKYLLTATYRADGSSKFKKGNKWGYFPSVAVAWKVSNEEFLKNITLINNLKLRVGWGLVGNQDIGNYRYGSALVARPSDIGNGFLLSNHPNPDVKWESSSQTNLGIDIGVLNNRVQLTVEVYKKLTDDLLIRLPLPNYMGGGSWMGIESPWVNMGKLENKGIEFTLNTVNISKNNFSWSTDITFSHNKNKILSLGLEDFALTGTVQWDYSVTKTEVGQPVGQYYGHVVDRVFVDYDDIVSSPKQLNQIAELSGVWPGDYRFVNIDTTTTQDWIIGDDTLKNVQVIDALDKTYIGNPNPKFTYGISNRFTYKNFELTIYLQGMYGHKIYNFTRSYTEGMKDLYRNQLNTVNNRARVEMIDQEGDPDDPANYYVINPETDMPRAINVDPNDNRRVSSRYVEDGSFMRIKNLSFGYTVPASVASKINATRLKVYVNIQNLYTFTKYSGYDPEIGSYNQDPLVSGVDNGRYPVPRIYSLGVYLDF